MPSSLLLMPARGPERENLSPIIKVNRRHCLFFCVVAQRKPIFVSAVESKDSGGDEPSLFHGRESCVLTFPLLPLSAPLFFAHSRASSGLAVPRIPPIPPTFPCDQRRWQSTGPSKRSKVVVIVNLSGVTPPPPSSFSLYVLFQVTLIPVVLSF